MRIVTANEMKDWLSHGEILEKDSHGPKVVKLVEGNLLKIFRSRRHPLLVRLMPDALRFAQREQRLSERGIQTPQIRECFWIDKTKGISGCIYQPLEGMPLDRIFLRDRPWFDTLIPQLASYILSLHQRGIYFRSLHLGNVLLTPDGGFGLIDFLDTRFKRGSLSPSQVRRNFQHLRNYLHRSKIKDFPWDELIRHYQQAAQHTGRPTL